MRKITIQEYADTVLHEHHKQPLLTLQQACTKAGWDFSDHPICCGAPVELYGFMGVCDQAKCPTCGKFVADITRPVFGNGVVSMTDPERVDLDTEPDRRWISSVDPAVQAKAATEKGGE